MSVVGGTEVLEKEVLASLFILRKKRMKYVHMQMRMTLQRRKY